MQYPHSNACEISRVRDLPPLAGSIIWARQIERQLNAYMRRVEAVLGKGWESHVDGQKLKADGDSFRLKLNTQELFEDWSRKVTLFHAVVVVIAISVQNILTIFCCCLVKFD